MKIQHVELTHVNQVWPLVQEYLESALTKDNDAPAWSECYNIHHVQAFVTSGLWLLLVASDDEGQIRGAATVSFSNYPMNRIAFITLIGGKLISNSDTFEQLRMILKQRGATKVQGYGRESIVRLWKRFGFEPRTTLVEVKL